jgi:cyclase
VANLRLIARLDIKGPNLIKGVHLEGLRVIGDPQAFAKRYYEEGVDELVYMDVVASLYGRNSLAEIVSQTAQHVFVPITVGGGIRSPEDAQRILRAGADKIAANTAVVRDPALISRIAERFGSQCMVVSIEAKRLAPGRWEAYVDNGRERTGRDVAEWAQEVERRGAGEILLTSVDQEGTRAGFDIELARTVTRAVRIPVIASGGLGATDHLIEVVKVGNADAVAVADALHYRRLSIRDLRTAAQEAGLHVRPIDEI